MFLFFGFSFWALSLFSSVPPAFLLSSFLCGLMVSAGPAGYDLALLEGLATCSLEMVRSQCAGCEGRMEFCLLNWGLGYLDSDPDNAGCTGDVDSLELPFSNLTVGSYSARISRLRPLALFVVWQLCFAKQLCRDNSVGNGTNFGFMLTLGDREQE